MAFSFKRHFYSSHSVSGIQPSSYTRSLLEDGDDAEMPTGLSNIESMIWNQNQKLSVKTRASISPEELGLQIDVTGRIRMTGRREVLFILPSIS